MRVENKRSPEPPPRVEVRSERETHYLVTTTRGDRLVPAHSEQEAMMLAQDMGYLVESVSKFT